MIFGCSTPVELEFSQIEKPERSRSMASQRLGALRVNESTTLGACQQLLLQASVPVSLEMAKKIVGLPL